jgi:hypothetical protein
MLRQHWAIPGDFFDNTDANLLAFAFCVAFAQDVKEFFE